MVHNLTGIDGRNRGRREGDRGEGGASMIEMSEEARNALKAFANKHRDFFADDEALLEQPLRAIGLFVKEAIDWREGDS